MECSGTGWLTVIGEEQVMEFCVTGVTPSGSDVV
jgi:hypothetical protein